MVYAPTFVCRAHRGASSTVRGSDLADHFETLTHVHEERYEPTHGALRPVVRAVVERFLDCGLLEDGFARVRGATCRMEFLVASRSTARGFCPKRQRTWDALHPGQLGGMRSERTVAGDTNRAVFAVRFPGAIDLLHADQKKSKRGIKTPRKDPDLMKVPGARVAGAVTRD